MVLRHLLLLFSFLVVALSSQAQNVLPSDSTPPQPKAKFHFGFDSRNSFVRSERAKVFGLRLGKEVVGSHRWGIGLYSLSDSDSLSRRITVQDSLENVHSLNGRLNFGYLAFFWEQIFYSDERWEISTPLQFGLGSAQINYIDPLDNLVKETQRSGLFVFEPTVYGQYQMRRWVAVGLGLGYRVALINNNLLDERLSSPIYAFRIKILLGEIIKMLIIEPIQERKRAKKG